MGLVLFSCLFLSLCMKGLTYYDIDVLNLISKNDELTSKVFLANFAVFYFLIGLVWMCAGIVIAISLPFMAADDFLKIDLTKLPHKLLLFIGYLFCSFIVALPENVYPYGYFVLLPGVFFWGGPALFFMMDFVSFLKRYE